MTVTTENKYAIVGIGGLFPDADNAGRFWQNILEKRVSIERLPENSVEREVFFRPESRGVPNRGDLSYTDLLATIRDIKFDPRKFRIPPAAAAQMDDNQKLALLVAEEALSYDGLKSVSNDRVSVFMGNTMIGLRHHHHKSRFDITRYEHYLKRHPAFTAELSPEAQQRVLADIRERLANGAPLVNEDTAPGLLPNIIASRINSVFDLHGHAYIVDAACASGLAAVILGIQQLRLGEADAVICGAADLQNEEMGRIYFSGIGALSPNGSFPFDARADGFVVGDGAGAAVIKRLDDALSAGDKIFAVISGYGQASDGKGKAVAAPNDVWQAKTIERAWRAAGAPIDTVELIEAHGTSTQVGDISEVKALKASFSALGASKTDYCGIGSVKSNIGHLKSAAGIAGFLKAVLALEHKVLPPSAGFEKENPKLELGGSPFYVLSDAREWRAADHPRRAGVSAFGFGGADYHIALEEYRERDYAGVERRSFSVPPAPKVGRETSGTTAVAPTTQRRNSDELLPEVLLFSGQTEGDILQSIEACAADLTRNPSDLSERITKQNLSASPFAPIRLGIVLRSISGLWEQLEQVKNWLDRPNAAEALLAKGIALGKEPPIPKDRTAILFPGQGSQYPNMSTPLTERYAAALRCFERADALWRPLAGHSVTDLTVVPEKDEAAAAEKLRDTRNTHPAVVTASLAVFSTLKEMGLRPAAMLGHSVGEFTALAAAGRLSFADAVKLVFARADAFSLVPEAARGAMAALPVDVEEALSQIAHLELNLAPANINSPTQTIVSGAVDQIERLVSESKKAGRRCVRLNVSHAFHSPMMEQAEIAFRAALDAAEFVPGEYPVLAGGTYEYYGDSAEEVRRTLSTQITDSVRFRHSIERLYAEGKRLFVEAGPGSVLTGLVKSILADKPVTVIATDNRKGSTLEGFLGAAARLFAAGLPVDPSAATRNAPARNAPSAPVEASPKQTPYPTLVYSGVSAGLPGSYKETFRDDNFDQLFEGRNLIEQLSDEERGRMVDLDISKVVKSAQGAGFKELTALTDVIQLAGKMGMLNLGEDYHIDEKDIRDMSGAIAAAVAAGYEALKDAHIPLVHEYSMTAGGSMLPERWSLPKPMQVGTGVIFANGFPMVEPIIEEVSKHLSGRMGSRARETLFEMYDSLIENVSDRDARKRLLDWYVTNRDRLAPRPDKGEVYRFNYRLMTQIAMQANNRLARLVNARGPNFQINAACSSTCTAIALAESLIVAGKAERMVIIGGDDPTSTYALPYLGAGFLSTGACTSVGNLYEAALPFDRRRQGMIMGAGAVGIVIERNEACADRGIEPVCELLGSHSFNAAAHGSQLDVPRYADELDKFMGRMESRHGMRRSEMAKKLVYISHETYTPPRGGCAESEAVALQHVFGERFGEIEIGNTKGMTGHTMGASIEDAVAAKALQLGKAPPVVNHKVPDPALEGLKLSRGGSGDFEYALRMAAGFGSQGNYILLKRRAKGEERVTDTARHMQWLSEISGDPEPELTLRGRTLAVADKRPGAVTVERPNIGRDYAARRSSLPYFPANSKAPAPASYAPGAPSVPPTAGPSTLSAPPSAPPASVSAPPSNAPATASALPSGAPSAAPAAPAVSHDEARTMVMETISQITGYETNVLEPDMDLEADLGIDTVKQATVIATLAEKLALPESGELRMSEYPTIGHLISFCASVGGGASLPEAQISAPPSEATVPEPSRAPHPPARSSDGGSTAAAAVMGVIAEVSGYAMDILEPDMEMEADLGIDTVKQATIWSLLAERLSVPQDETVRMSEFATIRQMIDFFSGFASAASPHTDAAIQSPPTPDAPASGASVSAADVPAQSADIPASENRWARTGEIVRGILGELTPYPAEMIEDDLTLGGDLEMDDTAQRTLEAALRQRFGLNESWRLPESTDVDTLIAAVRQASAASQATSPTQSVGRSLLTIEPAPLAEETPSSLSGKRIWAVAEDAATLSKTKATLSRFGCTVFEILIADTVPLLPGGQAPDILLDLTASPQSSSLTAHTTRSALSAIDRAMDRRFELCKTLATEERRPAQILVATAVDGGFALDPEGPSASPIYGLYIGFYKAVRKEWPSSTVRILDLAPDAWRDEAKEALSRIRQELTGRGEGTEICYRGDRRMRVVATAAEETVSPEAPMLRPSDTVVVTGGGSGITAKIALAAAAEVPAKFALFGRTRPVPSARQLSAEDPEMLTKEKDAIRARLVTQGERVTPVRIEQELGKLLRSAEIFKTVEALRRLGAEAEYFTADVTDPSSLADGLNAVREKFGPITALIHGAGVEVSRALEKKTLDELRAVHRAKSCGAVLLQHLCQGDPIREIVHVSSISGRFGNAAQTDYSGANAFLDLIARTERRPGIRARSLLFSGWAETGMAWRNSYVRDNAESAGLNFIQPDAATQAALRELGVKNGPREVILHRGLGNVIDAEQTDCDLTPYPLIDWIDKTDQRITASHRRFSPKRDAFLDQHRLAEIPLMPGVGFMEMMAETAALQWASGKAAFVFRDLAFTEAFKLHRELPRDVRIVVSPTADGALGMSVRSPLQTKLSPQGDEREYARALVSVYPAAELAGAVVSPNLKNARVTTWAAVLEGADSRRQNVRFGPLFNEARRPKSERLSSEIRWSETGFETLVPLPREQLVHPGYPLDKWLVNPAFLDTLHQAGAVLAIEKTGHVYLPVGADEFTIFETPNRDGLYRVSATLRHLDDQAARYDISMVRQDGALCALARGAQFRKIQD